jgi:hypothetical protein
MFLGCEVALLFLPTSETNIAVHTLVFDNRLWILFMEMFFGFDMCVIGTLIPEFHSTEVAVKYLCSVCMFIACEVEFHFFPTSELHCAVVTFMFDDRLWILFLKMFFGFDVLVIDTLILTL